MRSTRVRERGDNKASLRIPNLIQRPFRMVKSITVRGRDRLDQTPHTIGNQQTFMRRIAFTHKFCTSLSAKIEERHTFRTVLSKRHVTSLFAIVPYRIVATCKRSARTGDMSPQQASTSHSKPIVIRNATVIRPIEKFFGSSKAPPGILHLPRTLGFKRRRVLIVPSIGHINNYRVSIIKYTPPRNRGVPLDVQFNGFCGTHRKRTNINGRFSRNTLHSCAVGHQSSIRRNIWVIQIERIRKFCHEQSSIYIINIRQVSRNVIAEN